MKKLGEESKESFIQLMLPSGFWSWSWPWRMQYVLQKLIDISEGREGGKKK